MKRVEGEVWWKPFGTMLSCIDAKDSQCHYDKSVEECQDICDRNPTCQLGYHISLEEPYYKQKKSICVPITDSYQWYNTQILNSLIPNKNTTKLSSNRGVRVTSFYNDKKYVSNRDLPKDFPSFLFSGKRVWLCTRDTDGTVYYLTDKLTFIAVPDVAVVLNMIIAGSSIFEFKKRILYGSYLQLLLNDTFMSLTLDTNNEFVWKKIQEFDIKNGNVFEIECPNDRYRWQFFNENDPQFIKITNDTNPHIFLHKDKSNRLSITNNLDSASPFFFKIIIENRYNQYVQRFYESGSTQSMNPITPVFADSMDKFLCDHYSSSCRYLVHPHEERYYENPFLMGILFLFSLDILLLLLLTIQKTKS